MSTQVYAENYYSFRPLASAFQLAEPHTAEQPLADVDARLVEAHNAFLARRYQDAIAAYRSAEALVYAQIDPGFPVGVVGRTGMLPRDPRLFDSLLSLGLEWANVLPVKQPVAPVRPRVAVDSALLGSVSEFDAAGIASAALTSPAAINAVADWSYARDLVALGDPASAALFTERARKVHPELMTVLESTPDMEESPKAFEPLKDGVSDAMPLLGRAVLADAIAPSAAARATAFEAATALPRALTEERSVGIVLGAGVSTFRWNAGSAPPIDQVRAKVYEERVHATELIDVMLQPLLPSGLALQLAHIYYFVVPLGLAECYRALGDYQQSEAYYLQAAAYPYLNIAIEGPYVWIGLANLYYAWATSLYRADQLADALAKYELIVMVNATVPAAGRLYTTPSLRAGADAARVVIADIPHASTLAVNPLIGTVVVEAYQQLLKLDAGLDYLGFPARSVPIWTFDYLQSVASNLAQLAVSAERDAISYLERADLTALTRQQLAQAVDQAGAEVNAAQAQADAATAEATVQSDALALAQQRALDARNNAAQYAIESSQWIVLQAVSSQVSGGDNGNANELNRLADELQSTGHIEADSNARLGAAAQLLGARKNREYELAAMQRTATEMDLAATQARGELVAAQARAAAGQAGVSVAALRQAAAQQNLGSFDSQLFTADVWHRLGDAVTGIYRRYLGMAIRTARLMQQAYNFENDSDIALIRADYASSEVQGFLAADTLLADIQSFTYDLITMTTDKAQPVRQTISLAQRYPYLFESQLRPTGAMAFDTRIEDFDDAYPGTYAGRIVAVEVEVQGIVPVSGVSGTLTNGGISSYRVPASRWSAHPDGIKQRIQPSETLVLSDYEVRQDTLVVPDDQRVRRVFQGCGLASTWRLDLPRGINDIDFGALTDVRLTFWYHARFDPALRSRVLAHLATLPGVTQRQVGIPVRWVYPDLFFQFQSTHSLPLSLTASDFPTNQTAPTLTAVGALVVTDGSVPASGLRLALSTPAHPAAITDALDARGGAGSGPGSAWAPLAAGTALGDYTIGLTAADNPSLVDGDRLDLTPIVNIVLLLGYSYTPRV